MSAHAHDVMVGNHLIHETSPYLLQHAHNPVDWRPWGDEALACAVNEDKPIFLSIGYSACHWCHVMEHESFENELIALFLNEHFISIKVDREERPDLDEIYMAAVQLMTGSGGWPMSVFLTPDLRPFYGGTYFPPSDMYGHPGFLTILQSVMAAWQERREAVIESSLEITGVIQKHLSRAASMRAESLTQDLYQKTTQDLYATFDRSEGGFGSAPKFPPSPAIAFLLRQYYRSQDKTALDMATLTLDKMAAGGMFDQVGGGFHRYSVDEKWLVPHFEKMLYDNAQLAQVYLEAYQVTGTPEYRETAERILEYVLRDMADDSGGFHSSEDADSEGEEGRFYLWTHREIVEALGAENAKPFCRYYGIQPTGNFQSNEPDLEGKNILHVSSKLEELAARSHVPTDELKSEIERQRQVLLHARADRIRPGKDDKILTAWNALMISALAAGYRVTEDPRYRAAAERAGDFILDRMTVDGELRRSYRLGVTRHPGFLDDYAFTIVAMIDLYEATFEPRWFDAATSLSAKMIALFWDRDNGGFFFTAPNHANLIARSKPILDGAEPSANAMAALGLFRLARLSGNANLYEKARQTIEANASSINLMPRAFLSMLNAAEYLVSPLIEIALVGTPGQEDTQALLRVVHGQFIPNKTLALRDPNGDAGLYDKIPLLKEKEMVANKATAYVCKNFTCEAPVTAPDELLKGLRGMQ